MDKDLGKHEVKGDEVFKWPSSFAPKIIIKLII
jgi:hypothetical protein